MFHPVDVRLAVHPVVRLQADTDAAPGGERGHWRERVAALVFTKRDAQGIAAAVNHSTAIDRVEGDAPQVRFPAIRDRTDKFKHVERLLCLTVANLEV